MSFFRSGHQSYTGTITNTLGRVLFVSIKSILYKRLNDKKKPKKNPKNKKHKKTQENKTQQNKTNKTK